MTAPVRMAAVEAFYRAERATLEKNVAKRVSGANRPLIEDACQFAWTVLLRRRDVSLDRRGLAWLAVVAIREARRMSQTVDVPTGAHALADEGAPIAAPGQCASARNCGVQACGPSLEERIVERERHECRVDAFSRLKAAERQALALKAIGYSYKEIGELTGASYTAVNRRLSEGRARLRRM